jgi:hypothetical protein
MCGVWCSNHEIVEPKVVRMGKDFFIICVLGWGDSLLRSSTSGMVKYIYLISAERFD